MVARTLDALYFTEELSDDGSYRSVVVYDEL